MSFAHQTPLRARFTSGTSTPGKELRALLNDFDEDSPLPTLPGEDNKFATEARQSPSLGKGLPAHRVRNGFGVGERGKDGSASPFRRSVSLQDGALPDRRYINLLANSTSSSSSTYHDRKDKDSSTLPVLPSPKQQLSYSQNTPPTSSTIMSQSHDNNSGGSRRSAYSQTSSSRSGLTNTSTNADHSMAVTPPFDIGDETHPRSGGSNDSGLSSSQAQRGGGRFYGSQSRYPKASGLAGRRVVSQPMPSDSGVGVGERYETENPDGVVDLVQTLGGRDAAAERRARMESNESRYDISELGLSTISSAGETTSTTHTSHSSTTMRPSHPRTTSTSSIHSTGTDSPSNTNTHLSSLTPAATKQLGMSASGASGRKPRFALPQSVGPARRPVKKIEENESEVGGGENVAPTRVEQEDSVRGGRGWDVEEDMESRRKSPTNVREEHSPPQRASQIRTEPLPEIPRRATPPSRSNNGRIPDTISEEESREEPARTHMDRYEEGRQATSHARYSPPSSVAGGTGTLHANNRSTARTESSTSRTSPTYVPSSYGRDGIAVVDFAEGSHQRQPPINRTEKLSYDALDLTKRKDQAPPVQYAPPSGRPGSSMSSHRSSPPLGSASSSASSGSGSAATSGHQAEQSNAVSTPAPAGRRVFPVNGTEYEKLYRLGKGGSGTVYAVLDPNKRKTVALKRVDLKGDREMYASFKNEVELLERLSGHDRIIEMLEWECTYMGNGRPKFLTVVMEAGEASFDELLDEQAGKPLNLSWVATYWEQMLEAVQAVHDQKVVHSDLKPANFVIVKGRLKIIDFGIAKAIANDTVNISRDAQVGTVNYMSPEAVTRMSGGHLFKLSYPSDAWSLGVILYQMIYGKCPFWYVMGGALAKMAYIGAGKYDIKFKTRYRSDVGAFEQDTRLDEPADSFVSPAAIKSMRMCLIADQKARWDIPQLLNAAFLHPERDTDTSTISTNHMYQMIKAVCVRKDQLEHGGGDTYGNTADERMQNFAKMLIDDLQRLNGHKPSS